MFDMGPPVHMSEPTTMGNDVIGWLPLTKEEADGVEAWLADMLTRSIRCLYIGCPAFDTVTDPVNGRVTGRRFSCAGFVQCAYAEGADVEIVLPADRLPVVDGETVHRIWERPPEITEERWQRGLEASGLSGSGPWRLLLPGYLFHALQRVLTNRSGIPFQPTTANLRFP